MTSWTSCGSARPSWGLPPPPRVPQRERDDPMVAPSATRLEVKDGSSEPSQSVVEIRGVSRRFGRKLALDDVTPSVSAGEVLGLVGENGAGKTTLIRHMLGLLKAETGDVRVFGHDPVLEPVSVLSRIGYLSEEPDLPGWMRVHELLRYVSAFYPTWDSAYAEQLRRDFSLDPLAKIKHLSKGQRARAGLLAALAYRPDLLLLDEPSSGLDPIVRRDTVGAEVVEEFPLDLDEIFVAYAGGKSRQGVDR